VIPGTKGGGRVLCWLPCRIVAEVVWDEDVIMGSGWGLVVHLILLEPATMKPLEVLYCIESQQLWLNARDAYRRASVTGGILYQETQARGLPLRVVQNAPGAAPYLPAGSVG
jgi:hypothetical protein